MTSRIGPVLKKPEKENQLSGFTEPGLTVAPNTSRMRAHGRVAVDRLLGGALPLLGRAAHRAARESAPLAHDDGVVADVVAGRNSSRIGSPK